jgi:hypothetical protein
MNGGFSVNGMDFCLGHDSDGYFWQHWDGKKLGLGTK